MSKPDAFSASTSPAPPPQPQPLPRVFFAVTGFGPFAGVTENPTQKVVEGLRQRMAAAEKKGEEEEEMKKEKKNEGGPPSSSSSPPHLPPPPPLFSLARSVVKTEVLRVSAADVERWVRVDLEEAARAVAGEVERAAEAAKAAGAAEAAEAKATTTTATTAAAATAAATGAAPSTSPPSPSPSPSYHFVAVHLGVYASATSPKVRLETRAHNSADFRVPDADGKVLLREAITKESEKRWWRGRGGSRRPEDEERERRLESGLPLARVALRLSEEQKEKEKEKGEDEKEEGPSSPSSPPPPPRGWTVATTDDAGRYLCNFIYWHSLCACSSRAEKEKEEEKKPLLLPSFLRRPMALLQQQQRKNGGEEEEGEKRREKAPAVVRHAVFVHLPPAEVLPVESQLEVVERLLWALAEELVLSEGRASE